MGAHEETVILVGQDLDAEFRTAQQVALIEHGHQDGYNGTIATAAGLKLVHVDSSEWGRTSPQDLFKAAWRIADGMPKAMNKVPKHLHNAALQIAEALNTSKRGYWPTVEITGRRRSEILRGTPLAGKHGIRVWRTEGLAAS